MPPPPADEDAGPGAASGGVLAQVRAATRPVHDALDALLPLGLRDYEDYRRYLGALLALADWLARGYRPAWPAHLAGWNDARRLQCLRADCLALGVHATPVRTPPPATPARWLGGCYVIEGSALGARLLSRHAAALAEARPEAGAARSFLGHVTADARRWRRFARLLDALPARDAAAAVSGARDGFAIVHTRLAPEGMTA